MASGSIERRVAKDGTVAYRVTVELPPHAPTGKRDRRRGTFRTKREAEQARARWVAEVDSGSTVRTSTLTLAELCARWLEVKRPDLKPRTLEHYEAALARITGQIGALPAQKVGPAEVDAFYAALRADGCSDHTLHRVHQRLRQVFDYATKRRLVATNAVLAVDTPRVRYALPTVLTGPQVGRFLTRVATDTYAPLWQLLLQTGLRRGEALGLRWEDLDLDGGRLRVRQCVEARRGVPHLSTPKTAHALRTITLFPETVVALRQHRAQQEARRARAAGWEGRDLVFCTGTGGLVAPTNVLRNLRAIIGAANAAGDDLPRFDIHDLRHTHATHLLHAGWSVPTVSRRLGHAHPGITMAIYAHALSDVPGEDVVVPPGLAFTVKV
jgi:integrase